MSRQIKFRAWVYDESGHEFGMYYSDKEGLARFFDVFFPIRDNERDVLMQFTGLYDKHGEDIYEGDILKLNGGADDFYGDVKFENGCFVFNAHWINEDKMKPELYHYTAVKFIDCEVAGNIYETPELIAR